MPNWELLIGEDVLASVLPTEYRRYVRPIRGALAVFLQSLPVAYQRAILAQQASLPVGATPAERLTLLARSCPTLHKLGQTLARDRRLSPEFRRHLQQLESLPPSIPFSTIERLLRQEFGPLERLGVQLVPPAVAEASVAVVAAFRADRTESDGRPRLGVFKILKPGIEERLERELESLPRIGSYLDQQCDDLAIPHLDYQDSLEHVRDKLRQEIRLDLEQEHLREAAELYQADPEVQIPALFEHCTARVTAMELITGQKITEHCFCCPGERSYVAELAVAALIAKPFFSKDPHTFFHADPHAGNLFLTADQRLAILDWSLVGSLTENERVAIAQITLGALTFQPERILAAIAGLAERGLVDRAALQSVVDAWLMQIRQGAFPGLTWLVGMLDEAIRAAGLRVRADLLLFRKMFHSLEGVLADIGAAGLPADWALGREFLGHFTREWPLRWWMPVASRAFSTRLSNADLAELLLGLPWSTMQFWLTPIGNRGCWAA
jgi:ubiquinone biosynthesis protein